MSCLTSLQRCCWRDGAHLQSSSAAVGSSGIASTGRNPDEASLMCLSLTKVIFMLWQMWQALFSSLTLVITPDIVSGSIFRGSFVHLNNCHARIWLRGVLEQCCNGMQLSLYFALCGHRCIQSTNRKSRNFWQKYARMLTLAYTICFYFDGSSKFLSSTTCM